MLCHFWAWLKNYIQQTWESNWSFCSIFSNLPFFWLPHFVQPLACPFLQADFSDGCNSHLRSTWEMWEVVPFLVLAVLWPSLNIQTPTMSTWHMKPQVRDRISTPTRRLTAVQMMKTLKRRQSDLFLFKEKLAGTEIDGDRFCFMQHSFSKSFRPFAGIHQSIHKEGIWLIWCRTLITWICKFLFLRHWDLEGGCGCVR